MGKLQEITDGFLVEKEYISIFFLTETKESCANFQDLGITLYDKQRSGKQNQDKGGGVMIGHLTDERIKMEKIDTESEDILIVEGEVYKEKIRIILVYFNCGKLAGGRRYEEIEKYRKKLKAICK